MSCCSIPDLGLGWWRDKDSFALGLVFQSFCHVGKELQFSYNRRMYKIPPYRERGPEGDLGRYWCNCHESLFRLHQQTFGFWNEVSAALFILCRSLQNYVQSGEETNRGFSRPVVTSEDCCGQKQEAWINHKSVMKNFGQRKCWAPRHWTYVRKGMW